MKNEIKIQNSRLKLVQLDYEQFDNQVIVHKENLKYQAIYFINDSLGTGLCSYISIAGFGIGTTGGFKFNIPISISDKWKETRVTWKEAWVIEKTNTKNPEATLSIDEKKVLISILPIMMKEDHLDTAELLCRAIKDSKLLNCFYESYGDFSNMYKISYNKYCSLEEINDDADISSELLYASRRKYSVYDLLNDLIADKASIYTDYELIGKHYKKISKTVRDGSEYVPDKWKNIISLIGNRTRANLSLAYYGIVSVDIPKNSFGIPEGPKELKTIKSYCIVKDGVLWTSLIGVRVNSKKLIKKLKLVGVVKGELVFENELLLDLKKLPIIRKSQMKVRPIDLARAEANIKLAEVAQTYLRKKKWMDSVKVTVLPDKIAKPKKSDKEEFLNNLGIYGDTFVPTKVTSEVKESYNAYQIISSITGIPQDPYTQIRNYVNNPARCNNVVKSFLDKNVLPDTKKGKSYDELIKAWEDYKERNIKQLRDLKFRLIMGKNLKLYEHKSPDVQRCVFTLNVPNTDKNIRVRWAIKKTSIEV